METSERSTDPIKLQALTDMAKDDARVFETIRDTKTAQAVLQKLYSQLTVSELMERARHSQFSGDLLRSLLKLSKGNTQWLQDMMSSFQEKGHEEWDMDALESFVDVYWSTVIGERVQSGDFKNAWSEIGKAYRGFPKRNAAGELEEDRDTFESASHGGLEKFAASMPAVESLITNLYQRMADQGLVMKIAPEITDFKQFEALLPEQDRTSYYIPTGLPAADGRTIKPHKTEGSRTVAGTSFAHNFMRENSLTPTA